MPEPSPPPPIAWDEVALPGLGEGTVALVTGATGVLGQATARALTTLGVRVVGMARSVAPLEDLAQEVGNELLELAPGDVAVSDDVDEVVGRTLDRWGRLDVLVNLAAVHDSGRSLDEVSVDELDRVLAVNVRGTLLTARAAARPMRAQGRGRIITSASIVAGRASAGAGVYPPSKAAVIRLTRQLAVDLGPDGITVNCVSPGQTPGLLRRVDDEPGAPLRLKRPRSAPSRVPLQRRGAADDYVGAILFLASDLAQYVTGAELLVEGGASLLR